MAHDTHEPFDPETTSLIRRKARRICRHRGFSATDMDDVRQELLVHLWLRAGRFNPTISTWLKYASFILDKRAVSMLRERAAEKRSRLREDFSLDDSALDNNGRLVGRDETTPEVTVDTADLRDLERDLARVLSGLSDEMRAIALGLAAGTPYGVAGQLGISRRAMTKGIEQLREIFRDAGLDQYL